MIYAKFSLARKIYAERNYAERNYEQNQIEPVIDLLGKIATGNDDIEVKTIFAEGKNPATLMLERLVDYVPKAIDKIIKIYN